MRGRSSRFVAGGLVLAAVLTGCSEEGQAPGGGPAYGGAAGPLNPAGIPAAFVPLIEGVSGKYCPEITGAALAAQLKQESGFRLRIVNPDSGASGPAQFMPATWTQYGKDADGNGTNSPFDPADAVDAQARYMCDLVAMMRPRVQSGALKGDVLDLAWAGYNAGQGKVFLAGGIPDIQETKDYIRILRQNMLAFTAASPGGAGSGQWANPLKPAAYQVLSTFGPRKRPCPTCSADHKGTDMPVPTGTQVKAACGGTVLAASTAMQGLGTAVVLKCGKGIRTYYGHMSALRVMPGATVKPGQVVGLSGNTGNSTGPHLHFEIHTDSPDSGSVWAGTAIDPVPFMKQQGVPL